MTNINRDYFVILDVKSGELSGSTQMYFYNTDKNTSNIYVQLVVRETPVDATPIENATNYIVEAKIVKPGPVTKDLTATLVNESEAIYEFDLPDDCTNLSGSYKIEFWVKAKVADRHELITSSKAKYKVKKSILTDLDEAIEDSTDYPLLLQLMEEVRVINNTAHELDAQIRTLQSDMIEANNEMKVNEEQRQANEVIRETNEAARITQENARQEYLNAFDVKWEEYKTNTTNDITDYKESINTDISNFKSTTSNDIANYKSQIDAQEVIRETNEEQRKANEQRRITNEDERKVAENQRKANEFERRTNEAERKSAEASRVSAENTRATNEEQRQTNEANRETAEEIRKANEQARIAEHEAMRAEHEQTMTAVNEVKAENAILMENDKKVSDRMTQVEISDKRQYVIMEGLMNSAGDGYLKIEDAGNDTTLYNSVEGFVDVKNITGNTMVNSIKNSDDELTLNGDINTSGQSMTLTTAVDGGQVDVLVEGNTMVNVCDQKDPVAITKSYTVETGNHVALQGEYDGKARPVPTGNTLVNLAGAITNDGLVNKSQYLAVDLNINLLVGKDYTFILDMDRNSGTGNLRVRESKADGSGANYQSVLMFDSDKKYQFIKFTPEYEYMRIVFYTDDEGDSYTINNFMILEGDYTNKPIPDYFEGMQSSFEDNLVTQEMVDSGKELAENLGKYKVEYKVTGKNKININNIYTQAGGTKPVIADNNISLNITQTYTDIRYLVPIKKNTKYYFSYGSKENCSILLYYGKVPYGHDTKLYITNVYGNPTVINPSEYEYITIRISSESIGSGTLNINNLMLRESTSDTYEPYKEFTKSYYLNSPLLEGDTIEESNGNVYHVHRYEKTVLDGSENWEARTQDDYWITSSKGFVDTTNVNMITDKFLVTDYANCISGSNTMNLSYGIRISLSSITATNDNIDTFKAWLSANPITVVYQLASPQYELISQNDTILTDSYVAGHLDFDTAVPVEKVEFGFFGCNLKYMYPSTNYIIQFESDNIGYIDQIYADGNILNQPVVKGLNKFILTTTDTIISNYLAIKGIGFSASNIVVTEATDKDFGYFSGMKSVGELEENKIEILSRNKNLWYHSVPTYTYGIESNNNGIYTTKALSVYGTFGLSNSVASVSIDLFNGISKVDKGKKYTGSCKMRRISGTGDLAYFAFFGFNKNNLKYSLTGLITSGTKSIDSTGEWQEINFTGVADNNYELVIPAWQVTKNASNAIFEVKDIQLEEGDTVTDYIPHASNKKQILLNEPLRAVGDIKDRFVQIDGKWYIERNCREVLITSEEVAGIGRTNTELVDDYERYSIQIKSLSDSYLAKNPYQRIINNSFYSQVGWKFKGECIFLNEVNSIGLILNKNRNIGGDDNKLKTFLDNNQIKFIYELASPTYEPVEIAPTVNTYTDVTHITNNSTIPMNMPIVNSGYEVIAKPNTKYTVVGINNGRIGDSTIVNGTITTPATITDNFLRPYGTGKTSKVMLLEGEPANIPGYFKGIKSVFEDKVTDDGKYAVEVKVIGKNKFDGELELGNIQFNNGTLSTATNIMRSKNYINVKPSTEYKFISSSDSRDIQYIFEYDCNKNFIKFTTVYGSITTQPNTKFILFRSQANGTNGYNIPTDLKSVNIQLEEGTVATEYEPYHETKQTLYLDEPLYNTNNITIYNDKLGYWKNWDKIVLDGSDDEGWGKSSQDYDSNINITFSIPQNNMSIAWTNPEYIMNSSLPISDNHIWKGQYEGVTTDTSKLMVCLNRAKLSTQDIAGFKQYLSQNPLTVVYQLREPVFVPLIDNCPNWVIGSWDNCSIHFDSIIPLKDTRYRYTGNVPSVMAMSNDVAETKSISDQQDSMIIDLATDVAVMEMMLM